MPSLWTLFQNSFNVLRSLLVIGALRTFYGFRFINATLINLDVHKWHPVARLIGSMAGAEGKSFQPFWGIDLLLSL
jgi:hypothetical protein